MQIATSLRAAVLFPEQGFATGGVLSPGTAQICSPSPKNAITWAGKTCLGGGAGAQREEKSRAGSDKIFLVMELMV